MTNVEAR